MGQTAAAREYDPEELQLREAVTEYLAEHPQAGDTLEGIAQWWIARRQIRVDVERLYRVLRRLTEAGVLEELGWGERAVYRLRRPAPDKPEGAT